MIECVGDITASFARVPASALSSGECVELDFIPGL